MWPLRKVFGKIYVVSAGFTLLELLVSLTLLSLLFLLVASGIQFGTKAWRETELSDTSEVLGVQYTLRRLLSEARPIMIEGDEPNKQRVLFMGTENSIRFVSPMPPYVGAGGFYEIAIYLAGNRVEMSWNLFHRGDASSESAEQRITLINGVSQIHFAYFGLRETKESAKWYNDWQDLQYTPDLIRMRVDLSNGSRPWPDLVAAPMVRSVNLIIQDPETVGAIDHLPSAPDASGSQGAAPAIPSLWSPPELKSPYF